MSGTVAYIVNLIASQLGARNPNRLIVAFCGGFVFKMAIGGIARWQEENILLHAISQFHITYFIGLSVFFFFLPLLWKKSPSSEVTNEHLNTLEEILIRARAPAQQRKLAYLSLISIYLKQIEKGDNNKKALSRATQTEIERLDDAI